MKLSEAIRLGAMLRPPGPNGRSWPHKSCVLQAGAEALGLTWNNPLTSAPYAELRERYRFLNGKVSCPACNTREIEVIAALYHLNDQHHWSREQIADWLEREVEPKEESVEQREPDCMTEGKKYLEIMEER